MINLYYDKNLHIEAEKYQLFPLLEVLEYEDSPLNEYYTVVKSVEACDLGVVPMNVQLLFLQNKKREVLDFIQKCKEHDKKVLIFSGGDFGHSINIQDVFTVRLGGFDSQLDPNTFMMPPFIDDPYKKLSVEFNTFSKRDKPSIGFVGHANGSFSKRFKEYLSHLKGSLNRFRGKDVTDSQSFYPSSLKRYSYLNRIAKNKNIESNFILRDQYRAGIKTEEDKEATTLEFYQNINKNLYTFCSRGTGNFSVRFYETLAMGRIPVLVDTDCRLPFSTQIEWSDHCVIIPERLDNIEERLLDFHANKSQDELVGIQKKNRMIWQKYLTKSTYFIELAKELKEIKNKV